MHAGLELRRGGRRVRGRPRLLPRDAGPLRLRPRGPGTGRPRPDRLRAGPLGRLHRRGARLRQRRRRRPAGAVAAGQPARARQRDPGPQRRGVDRGDRRLVVHRLRRRAHRQLHGPGQPRRGQPLAVPVRVPDVPRHLDERQHRRARHLGRRPHRQRAVHHRQRLRILRLRRADGRTGGEHRTDRGRHGDAERRRQDGPEGPAGRLGLHRCRDPERPGLLVGLRQRRFDQGRQRREPEGLVGQLG